MPDVPFVKIAKALADPTRHKILQEIRASGEMTCTEVCERFKLAQPTISHHLKTLTSAGVVIVRAEGQYHVLSIDETVMRMFASELLPGKASNGQRGKGNAGTKKTSKKASKKTAAARR